MTGKGESKEIQPNPRKTQILLILLHFRFLNPSVLLNQSPKHASIFSPKGKRKKKKKRKCNIIDTYSSISRRFKCILES